jgi:hypothetical protein
LKVRRAIESSSERLRPLAGMRLRPEQVGMARARPTFEHISQHSLDLFDGPPVIHVKWMHRDPNSGLPPEEVQQGRTDKR